MSQAQNPPSSQAPAAQLATLLALNHGLNTDHDLDVLRHRLPTRLGESRAPGARLAGGYHFVLQPREARTLPRSGWRRWTRTPHGRDNPAAGPGEQAGAK